MAIQLCGHHAGAIAHVIRTTDEWPSSSSVAAGHPGTYLLR